MNRELNLTNLEHESNNLRSTKLINYNSRKHAN